MDHHLTSFSVLPEDPGLVPKTYVKWSQLPLTLTWGDAMPSSDLHRQPQMHGMHSHKHIHAHKLKIN